MMGNWSGKRILVTGAGGFIGSHLTEALIDLGCEVTAMIRYTSRSDWGNLEFLSEGKKKTIEVVAGTVEDPQFVARQVKGKEIVFHLAALIGIPYSYIAPQSYIQTNIGGTANILESVREYGAARVIHTSTSECYGTAQYTPIDEKHPLQPQSPYSATKIGADMLAQSFHRSFGTPVTIVRPFNTYGPRQSARAVIPTIITQALGNTSEICLGSLDPIRDLNFVKDIAHGFITIAERGDAIGKTINLGAGKGITIGDLAKRILTITNVNKPIVQEEVRTRPPESEVFKLVADNSQARALGWNPKYSLDQGLTETIEFVSQHPDLFKVGKYAT
jgi:NAD dependent epimerase/dehydratase